MAINRQDEDHIKKAPLKDFLAQNPFSHPLTLGLFYREKMRAIHRIAPDLHFDRILEVGGGQGGLTGLLYPDSRITNLDADPAYARAPCNRRQNVDFVCGDAAALPFADSSFAAVTLFDVLEHVPDDRKTIAEALRVVRPDGFILVSTPNENWRYPYYGVLRPICQDEAEIMDEWGHVRRSYTLRELNDLIEMPCQDRATFINPLTVVCHDVAFSRLPFLPKIIICLMISPLSWLGYHLHSARTRGTETAYVWQKT